MGGSNSTHAGSNYLHFIGISTVVARIYPLSPLKGFKEGWCKLLPVSGFKVQRLMAAK